MLRQIGRVYVVEQIVYWSEYRVEHQIGPGDRVLGVEGRIDGNGEKGGI